MGIAIFSNELPLWTDVVQAVGVIVGLVAFIKLFTRDRARETEIRSLTAIADKQKDIVIEMQKQLQQIEFQTAEMQAQTQLQKESSVHQAGLLTFLIETSTDQRTRAEEFAKRERAKRLTEIKPYFVFGSSMGRGTEREFTIRLVNVGHTAQFKGGVDSESKNLICKSHAAKPLIEKSDDLNLVCQITNNEMPYGSLQGEVTFSFTDVEGNEYHQTLLIDRLINKWKTADPVLIQ